MAVRHNTEEKLEKHLVRGESAIGQMAEIIHRMKETLEMGPTHQLSRTSLSDHIAQIRQELVESTSRLYDLPINLNIYMVKNEHFILINHDLIFQVYENIIENAVEHKATQISLTFFPKPNQILIRIDDDGEGIPGEILNKIGKVQVSTKEIQSGMGSQIIQKNIHAMGGGVTWANSPSGGVSVNITLPLT